MEATIIRSLLVLAWWIGIWGLADTFVHGVFRGSVQARLVFYGALVLLVSGTIYIQPQLLEHLS